MKLPSFESLLYKNTNEQQCDRKLLINDMEVENPFKMKVVNNFIDSPPFGLYDIFNRLICHSANCYDNLCLISGFADEISPNEHKAWATNKSFRWFTHYTE